MTRFGAPPDVVAWSALGLSALLLVVVLRWRDRLRARIERVPPRVAVAALACGAALLSAGYVAYYLRGGPRIIDATSYWLEARTLSHGHFTFSVPTPTGAFRGRFLVTPPGSSRLAVIFPPGYPALLALGFVVHAPLAVGPLLAAGIVVATYVLALELTARRDVALVAALLSVLCAALRYHTADTMSHGLSALLLATLLAAALRGGSVAGLVAGLAAGWLVATRPVSGAFGVMLAVLILRRQPRALGALAAGLVPGALLLLLQQHAVTGSWLGSSQLRYYALADGPPGCFRYGFGNGIGCRFEHGDFVRAHLLHGYGAVAALGTTGRRLLEHLADAGNVELVFLLIPFAVVAGWNVGKLRWAAIGVIGIVLAYAPFYFDGNYPGGGARFFADALPLEHVLIAWALVRLRAARFAAPVLLCGFALRASYDHRQLATREGGRPMFEPAVLARSGVTHGLVFVSTDHGFNLGHEPGLTDALHGIVVARESDDAHDRLLRDHLGRPATYRYVYDPRAAVATPRVVPYPLSLDPAAPLVLEAETEWPPLAVGAGSAYPGFSGAGCVSRGRGLGLHPVGGRARATIEIDAPASGRFSVVAVLIALEHDSAVSITEHLAGSSLRSEAALSTSRCFRTLPLYVQLPAGASSLEVEIAGGPVLLDRFELLPAGLGVPRRTDSNH